MVSYPLIIAQYRLEDHPRRSEHWSLVALLDANSAYVFELIGNSSTFQYSSKSVDRFSRSERLRGGCLVGHIATDKVDWLKNRLQGVPIVYNDPEFDCQTWILDALRLIRNDDGVEVKTTNEEGIRRELALEKERWDIGEDTIEDRLFPYI